MWIRPKRTSSNPKDLNLKVSKKCEVCGSDFFKPDFYAWKGWETKKYCSRKCYWTTVSAQKLGKKGAPNPNKGKGNGWLHKATGYCVRIHPVTGKKILVHRYVMECHIGRPLEKNEQVHHKNLASALWTAAGGKNQVYRYLEGMPKTSLIVELVQALERLGYEIKKKV